MIRQVMFRPDGTITDIPAKDTEKPQLEVQPDLFQYEKDKVNIKKWEANNEQYNI